MYRFPRSFPVSSFLLQSTLLHKLASLSLDLLSYLTKTAKSPFRPIGIVLSSQQLYEVEKTSDQVIFLKQGKQKNLHEKIIDNQEAHSEIDLVIEFESNFNQNQLGDLFTILNALALIFLK